MADETPSERKGASYNIKSTRAAHNHDEHTQVPHHTNPIGGSRFLDDHFKVISVGFKDVADILTPKKKQP